MKDKQSFVNLPEDISRRRFVSGICLGVALAGSGLLLGLPAHAAEGDKEGEIRACVFDTFGTLLDWRTSVARQVKKVADAKGVKGDWFDFADQWRGYYFRLTSEIGTYKKQFMPVGYIHRIGLDALLPEFGLGDLTEEERAKLNLAWHRLDPWPDTVEGLKRLKKKFIISPLSNSDFRMMVDMSTYAGLPWDAVLTSETAQAFKPDPRMYLQAPQRLNLEPSQVLMCAAHNIDLKFARAAGLPRSAFIARPTEFGKAENKYYKKEVTPDPVNEFNVTSVIELAEKLGA